MVFRVVAATVNLVRPASSSGGLFDLILGWVVGLVVAAFASFVAWIYISAFLWRRRLATWPREPAKILVLDRVEVPGEKYFADTYEVALVLEVQPEGRGAHRVELKQSMDRHLFDYIKSKEAPVFVRADPAKPGNFVLDEEDLLRRKEQGEKDYAIQKRERKAADEREAEAKRQRILRGD